VPRSVTWVSDTGPRCGAMHAARCSSSAMARAQGLGRHLVASRPPASACRRRCRIRARCTSSSWICATACRRSSARAAQRGQRQRVGRRAGGHQVDRRLGRLEERAHAGAHLVHQRVRAIGHGIAGIGRGQRAITSGWAGPHCRRRNTSERLLDHVVFPVVFIDLEFGHGPSPAPTRRPHARCRVARDQRVPVGQRLAFHSSL
jgi:hypothetical protein